MVLFAFTQLPACFCYELLPCLWHLSLSLQMVDIHWRKHGQSFLGLPSWYDIWIQIFLLLFVPPGDKTLDPLRADGVWSPKMLMTEKYVKNHRNLISVMLYFLISSQYYKNFYNIHILLSASMQVGGACLISLYHSKDLWSTNISIIQGNS